VIFELRRYQLTSPPMAAPFNAHMATMMPLFHEYGFSLVGAWDSMIANDMPFHTYLLRWNDLAHRETAWAAFYADPRFDTARDAMNERAGGLVVRSHTVEILRAGTYSMSNSDTER
jgi:hypothetical protein